ncbi:MULTISPECIES: hypothetical protein [Variovorax]|jgi:hypothetical protein|uniref:hypothetical protein n=1 Tax=Variovorax TaxID=34072 RepID=UPI00035C9EB6|nr:hypothetical protein [Variovorax paradoxus]
MAPFFFLLQRPVPTQALKETKMDTPHASCGYELRFQPLFANQRAFAFPCDAIGHVDMDSLSERMLNNYLYARAVMGLELSWPEVRASRPH